MPGRRDRTSSRVRQIRKLGTEAVLARIPAGARYYVTIDIDGFDPSIAPGTGTPSHGGFIYYEVLELLQGLAKTRRGGRHRSASRSRPTTIPRASRRFLAAQVLLNFLGYIFHEKASRKG